MRPLIADGGELTALRSLAAYSYGQWQVEWPDSVPEEQRPEPPDEREFGYVAKLDKEPGRMGRRFVRADVSITAAEYTPEGKVIPYSGFSDVEQVIDEAASRTTGDVFFEREIERAGLNGNIPYVDFDVDDLVPVTLWGKSTIVPVTSIQEVTEAGEAVGWRVRVGGDLIADDVARERANRDIEAAIAQERRERLKDVGEVSAAASRAQSTADVARDEVAVVRDTLAGEQSQEPDLLTQLVAVNDELQRLGQDPQPSLMLAFVQLSAALWQAQQKINQQQQLINDQQALINEQTQEINAAQSRSIQLLSLYNHGAAFIESSYVLQAKTWQVLDFSGVRGHLIGCEPIVVQNENSSGTGLRFLSPGDWEVNLRVTLPPGDAIIGTSTAIRVRVITPGGKEIGTAKATSSNKGSDETLSLRTTVSVPEAGSYVNAQAYASTTSGNSSWWPSDTGPELTELSVRQLSISQ